METPSPVSVMARRSDVIMHMFFTMLSNFVSESQRSKTGVPKE